ncbi:hypothetical protein EON77_00340 [bacterium]|nr:MAG: hypothetical protein EON77_00340 [bacterium]
MAPEKPSISRIVWPIVAVVLGGGAILLSNREPAGPGGRPIVRDADSYQRENAVARDLTLPIFAKAQKGEEVSNEERAKLLEAIPHLQAMNAYAPIKVGPYFAMGQIRQIRGELDEAGRSYEQAISNEKADWEEQKNPALHATVTEAKALLAETLLDYAIQRQQAGAPPEELKMLRERALSWADQAVKAQPDAPRYLAARASALLALNRNEEARAAVLAAVASDPNHFKVKPLASLLGL